MVLRPPVSSEAVCIDGLVALFFWGGDNENGILGAVHLLVIE
jgi:hypothetical protein